MAIYKRDDPDFFSAGPEWVKPIQALALEHNTGWGVHLLCGDPESNRQAPMAAMFYMPPGMVLARHSHDCYRVEVIVQGSIELPDGTILGPGDVSTSEPNVFYGPHVAGPEGSLSVEIFSRAAAMDADFADPESESAARLREAAAKAGI